MNCLRDTSKRNTSWNNPTDMADVAYSRTEHLMTGSKHLQKVSLGNIKKLFNICLDSASYSKR